MNSEEKIGSVIIEGSTKRKLPKAGSIVDGVVASRTKADILVDLGEHVLGIISGKHLKDEMGTAKSLKAGDEITAMVVEDEGEDGFVILSLRRASQERAWKFLKKSFEEGKTFEIVANSANRGGLILDYSGVVGFLPVSQLSPDNYPRVSAANGNEILQRLQKLIGKKFMVKCINLNEETRTIIVSERDAYSSERKEILQGLEIGNKVRVKIVGVANFGFFVTFKGLEGLIHISEISWDHVKNPLLYGKVGDEVDAMITNIENEKISLSIKQLTPDPWKTAIESIELNQIIEGEIKRTSSNGAYMEIQKNLSGLIPSEEVPENEDIFKFFSIGKKMKARVSEINEDERKIILSLDLDAISEAPAPKEEEKEEKEKKEPEKSEKDE